MSKKVEGPGAPASATEAKIKAAELRTEDSAPPAPRARIMGTLRLRLAEGRA